MQSGEKMGLRRQQRPMKLSLNCVYLALRDEESPCNLQSQRVV